jgi:hypothetical protein
MTLAYGSATLAAGSSSGSSMLEEVTVVCPACWEEIVLEIDLSAGDEQDYSEDCSVCCRPMAVRVRVNEDGDGCTVSVEPESD